MQITKWTLLLSIFWLGLSGFFQPLLLTLGVLSVALVIYVMNRMDNIDKDECKIGTDIRLIKYIPWLMGEIIRSSIQVTKLIWAPSNQLSPALAKIDVNKVPLDNRPLYANSITLTPGTLSVDLKGGEITVHALQASSIKALKEGEMEQKLTSIWGTKND